MKSKRLILRWSLLAGLVLIAGVTAISQASPPDIRTGELVFTGSDLARGDGEAVSATESGVQPKNAMTDWFTSEVIKAPLDFTSVDVQWKIDIPEGAAFELVVRTGLDGESWNQWVQIDAEDDLMGPAGDISYGRLLGVPEPDITHRYVQYRWKETGSADENVLLSYLRFFFIDGTNAPVIEPSAFVAHSATTADAVVKPPVVSRTEWGCPDGQDGPDSWPAEYVPVSHVIIHHTVGYYATMYDLWVAHAIGRGWGDVGYNFVVDRNGIIYEGRAGGNDVAGGHAYPYNHGTMGISFIGDYRYDYLTATMFNNAVELIAWKMDRRGIDPNGTSWLAPTAWPDDEDKDTYVSKYIAHISGHRDVMPTICPGDHIYATFGDFRSAVASRLNSTQYVMVSEQQAQLSDANWYDGPNGCGYNGHAYWTYSTTDPGGSENWGWWRPSLSTAGAYRVYAYVPYCVNGVDDSTGVDYVVHHASGETSVRVNQEASAGSWVELGRFNFNAGTGGYVFLDDVAVDDAHTIWFDEVRWKWDGEYNPALAPTNLLPSDQTWSKSRTVTFGWTASVSSGVDKYQLVISPNRDLSDPIHSTESDQLSYQYTFGADSKRLYWAVRSHNMSGYGPFSPVHQLGVDIVAPTANVDTIVTWDDGRYVVAWSGSDATSGVASYDVQFKEGASGNWTNWKAGTPMSAIEWPYEVTTPVWFRARATDAAGNVGNFDLDPGMSTDSAILVTERLWMPVIHHNAP